MKRSFLSVAALVLAAAGTSIAAPIVTNGGFEANGTSWTSEQGGDAGSDFAVTAPVFQGSFSAKTYARQNDWANLVQTITTGLTAGEQYDVSVMARSNSADGWYAQGDDTIKLDVKFLSSATGNYVFETTPNSGFTLETWNEVKGTFTMPADATGIELRVGIWAPSSNDNVYFDNVAITTVVPEPAMLSLAGLSGLALLARRQRKALCHAQS